MTVPIIINVLLTTGVAYSEVFTVALINSAKCILYEINQIYNKNKKYYNLQFHKRTLPVTMRWFHRFVIQTFQNHHGEQRTSEAEGRNPLFISVNIAA